MKFAITILNWNNKNLLEKFLPILLEHSKEASIYIIDNIFLLEDDNQNILMKEYRIFSTTQSEINEHLPTLYSLAKNCSSVVELGR